MQPHFSRHLLPPGTRLGLAVSGGADSVALLRIAHRLAAESGWSLRVLHVHHGLRAEEADDDAAFVASLANQLNLSHTILTADAQHYAREHQVGLEEAGRLLRYGWFRQLLFSAELDAVATGHTLDDQAETVLAKLLRGSWTAGLAGIYPAIAAVDLPGPLPGSTSPGWLLRPLLGTRRHDLRSWLHSIHQPWREDSSNNDPQFTRNRIRNQLLPAMTEFNPKITEQLDHLSILARDEELYWQAEVQRLLPELLLPGRPVRGGGRASSTMPGERSLAMEVEKIRALPAALARRLVRATAAQLGVSLPFAETERTVALLQGPVGSTARREQLTAELRVERSPRELRFVLISSRAPGAAGQSSGEELSIAVPGEGSGFGVRVTVSLAGSGEAADEGTPAMPPATMRAAKSSDRVTLRYSRGAPKKVKEVLERLGVPAAERSSWPVLLWQGELVWLRGAVLEPTPLASQLVITSADLPPATTGALPPATP